MMKTWHKAAAIGVMGVLAIYAITMADGKTIGKRGPQAAKQMALKGDKNKDGMLNMDEFLAGPKAKFSQIDANHDGQISREEMRVFRDKQRASREANQKKHGAQPPKQGANTPPAQPAAKPAEKK